MDEPPHPTPQDETTTWVPARRAVLQRLDHEIVLVRDHGGQLAVMMVGIDHLDLVVRRRGLPAKADVLRASADRLARSLRRGDVIGRYGEEEFLLVLPCCAQRHARAAAHRLREALQAAPLAASGGEAQAHATIGVVAAPPHSGASAAALALAARRAPWRARRHGGSLEMATVEDFPGERRSFLR